MLLLLRAQLRVERDGVLVFVVVNDAVGQCDLEVVAGGLGAQVRCEDVLDVGAFLIARGHCGVGHVLDGGLCLQLRRRWSEGRGVCIVLGHGEVGSRRGRRRRHGSVGEGEAAREEGGEVIIPVVGPVGLLLGGRSGGDEVGG